VLTVGSPALWSYSYDQNGNMLSDGSRSVGYDDQDRPNQITLNGVTTVFKYSPDGERYLQRTINTAGSINRTIYYVEYGTTTNHGFTGHEHLDETYLIHMNGRVYDYRLTAPPASRAGRARLC
jgi:hypothetical protein